MKLVRSIAAVLLSCLAILASMTADAQEISASGARVPVTIPNGGTGVATFPTGALKGAGAGALTQAGAVDLSNGVTGTGAVVLAASPTVTGTLTASTVSAGSVTVTGLTDSGVLLSTGSPPANSGTCSINAQLGGKLSGKFTANGACVSGTVILTFLAVNNGYACQASDLTTPADTLNQTAYTAATATFTGTLAASDVVVFSCIGF